MKRAIYIFISVVCCLLIIFYWGNGRVGAKLIGANKSISQQVDDFILHIHVEKANHGIDVFRSIQYVGSDPIEIEHQTPLISVSFEEKNHLFTGSTVSKTLTSGASYFPQNMISFPAPKKGAYTLFAEARIFVNGEKITIDHEETLYFE